MYANRKDSDGIRKKPSQSDLNRKEGDSMLKKNDLQRENLVSPRESRDAREMREARELKEAREAREILGVEEIPF